MANNKRLIIGNWKMNLSIHETSLFAHKLNQDMKAHKDVEVVIAPSTLALQTLSMQIDHNKIKLCAQNCYWRDDGAYTGEISANQLRGLVSYVLVGHSERRHIFGETDRDVRNKVQSVVRNRLKPVLCVGETTSERSNGETHRVINDQITGGLSNITSDEIKDVAIAYEPVWAVGTGDNAMPHEIQTVAKTIRHQVEHMFGSEAAKKIRILYGGSVTSDNVISYLETPGIDGLLIGGASLEYKKFMTIIDKSHGQGD